MAHFRKQWADSIITHLNQMKWTNVQTFQFTANERVIMNRVIRGKIDCYFLNQDIGGLLGKYVYEEAEGVVITALRQKYLRTLTTLPMQNKF